MPGTLELAVLKVSLMGECRVPRIINRLLFPDERIAFALKGVRDIMVFTNTRILYVDYRNVSGKSVEYATYMFKDVISYSIVTPGFGLDCDSEIVLRFINREVVQISIDKGHNLDRYLYLTYDLISAIKDNHPLQKGVFNTRLTVKENNEQFFE